MTIRLYMSMSLDGYIAGPDDREGQELGRGGGRLFNWLDERNGPGINGQVYAEALATGAIISGRRTFELAGRWNGDHHDDVPILILTHEPEPPTGNVRFFDDVRACAAEARRLSPDRPVMVHGACARLEALLDREMERERRSSRRPCCGGRPLFGSLPDHVELELGSPLEGNNATHLRFRVVTASPTPA